MSKQMVLQISNLTKCLFTGPTLVQLFPTVSEQMPLQNKGPSECLSQVPHLCGFSSLSLWVIRCLFKYPALVNAFSQVPQLWGFSFPWVRRCIFKYRAIVNAFPQVKQLCSFSSL